MNAVKKKKMTTAELVEHLKAKGVSFERCSEDMAVAFLKTKNDYFRVTAFRKLFPKHEAGKNTGCYIALDFDDLRQLSYVDQSLRSLLRTMSLDVEHYEKVSILNRITENEEEDGYKIVADYKDSLNEDRLAHLENEIKFRANDVYCGAIIQKYGDTMPVWAFFEVISFGTFIDFCRFCSKRWDDDELLEVHYMLKKAKSVRNAASHGACIINGFFEADQKAKKTPLRVRSALGKTDLSKNKRSRWLGNPRMRDIATMLYLFSEQVEEGNSKERARKELSLFYAECADRMANIPQNNAATAGIEFMKSLTSSLALG